MMKLSILLIMNTILLTVNANSWISTRSDEKYCYFNLVLNTQSASACSATMQRSTTLTGIPTQTLSSEEPWCTPTDCEYTWEVESLCNSASKSRTYPIVTGQPTCGGLPCPTEYVENDCSPPNGRYKFSVEASTRTQAKNKVTVVLKEGRTDSLVVEVCYVDPQVITSSWPMALEHIDDDGRCMYFVKEPGLTPMAPGYEIVLYFMSSRKDGEPVDLPWKIKSSGNCVVKVPDVLGYSHSKLNDRCRSGESIFADAEDCTKYYECVNITDGPNKMRPKAMSISCGAGEQFDDNTKTCVQKENAGPCVIPQMVTAMCDYKEDNCPENMYQETLYPFHG